MGLDTSHDCWHGSYTGFSRFRSAIAKVVGIDLHKMQGFGEYGDADIPWASLPADPLWTLLNHSDCDGELLAKDCVPIAERLEAIAPALANLGYAESALTFARGLRLAAERGENVEFR